MAVPFKTFDLGQVLQTSEAIKGMRRQAETDKLRDAYLGVQTQNAKANEVREQSAHDATIAATDARTKYLQTDAILRAQDPVAAVRQFAPDMIADIEKAQGPGSFDRIPPEQLKAHLQQIAPQLAAKAGIQLQAPEPYTLSPGQKRFGPDGKVMAEVAPNPRGNGISMTMPDGTEVQIGGDGVPNYGGSPMSKPTRTKLEEVFTNAQANGYALREQMAKYRPEFSTLAGKAKAGIANMKDMAGMANAPQQTQYLADFTAWKSDTARLLSSYLNQLSGAAISPHEETRLKAGFPNAEDGPTQYQAKAQSTMRSFALAQARAAYLLSNPAQSLDSVSLDSMSNIIADEANRLATALQQGGMQEAQAKQRAIADTRARYGMQ